MTARGGIEAKMVALREESERLAIEREGIEAEAREARATLAGIGPRRDRALVDAARGRSGESVEDLAVERGQLEEHVADLEARGAALVTAEREVGRELTAAIESDEGLAFYTEKANAASEAAVAAREHAESAIDAARDAWAEAARWWMRIHEARNHRGESLPPHVPAPEFGPLLAPRVDHVEPWPGGERPGSGLVRGRG